MIDLHEIAKNDKWLGFIQKHDMRRMAKLGKAAGRVLDSYGVSWETKRGGMRVVVGDLYAIVSDHGPMSFWGVEETLPGKDLPHKISGDSSVCFTAAVIEATVALVKALRRKYADAEAALISA